MFMLAVVSLDHTVIGTEMRLVWNSDLAQQTRQSIPKLLVE
jgi:hypothetical protein